MGVQTVVALEGQDAVFAANRTIGRMALAVAADGDTTRRGNVREEGAFRFRFPNAAAGHLEAVVVNTAGGLTGGDSLAIDLDLGAGARLLVGTTGAEKIYRTIGPATDIAVTARIAAGAQCAWLPQETILFDRASLRRRIDIDLAGDASLVLCEGIVYGRAAMGETVRHGRLSDHWRVRRDGKLVYAESVALDGDIAATLGAPAIGAGAIAFATLLMIPGDDNMAATVRGLAAEFSCEVGVSSWNGVAVARFCAQDGAALRRDLVRVLTELRLCPLPRLWLS